MLPPHPPFVQKIVKRKAVRRSPHGKPAAVPAAEAGNQDEIRIARRAPHPLKSALRVLGQARSGAMQG